MLTGSVVTLIAGGTVVSPIIVGPILPSSVTIPVQTTTVTGYSTISEYSVSPSISTVLGATTLSFTSVSPSTTTITGVATDPITPFLQEVLPHTQTVSPSTVTVKPVVGTNNVVGITQVATSTTSPAKLIVGTVTVTPSAPENKPPVASFVFSPEKPIVNEEITFDASASYDPEEHIVSYEWIFGDGNMATGEMVTHSYLAAGDYIMILTVMDNVGATTTTSKTVMVTTEWTFAIITDLHIGRGFDDYGTPGHDDELIEGQENSLTSRLADVVNWINKEYEKENIRFLAILGDITDSGEKSEFYKVKTTLNDLEIPYFPIVGNHDVLSKTNNKPIGEPVGDLYFTTVFNEDFFNQQFEKLGAIWSDKQDNIESPYLQNYAFSFGGINFIFIDFNIRDIPWWDLLGVSTNLANSYQETNTWLEVNMENRPEKIVNVFSHYPFMLEGGVSTDLTGNLGRIALMYSRDVYTFGGHVHYGDNRNQELVNTVYFLEIEGEIFYYEYPWYYKKSGYEYVFAAPLSVPVIVTKGMMEPDKDFLRIVTVEGTFTNPNNINYNREDVVKLDATCEIPEGPDPDTKILEFKQTLKNYWARLHSPGELRVTDTQGHVTGLVDGDIRIEIPNSLYFDGCVIVSSEDDSYSYHVVGTEDGLYGLEVTSVAGLEAITFAAIDIPTRALSNHQYTIDWDVLSQGEEGVTLQIDSDGDSVFEYTFTSDSDLTQSEYVIATDKTPPETWINIGEPKFLVNEITYLTSATPITLIAEDNPGGSGLASLAYRIHNSMFDSGWITYTQPFYLIGLSDGTYHIDYKSTDFAENVEPINTATVILDNSPPLITIETPSEDDALQDGIAFTASVYDLSEVASLTFSIREPDGEQGNVISPAFESLPAMLSADGRWNLIFDTSQLPDGYYLAVAEGTDVFGHTGFQTVSFSIRNWATVELLPASKKNKAGRTMPVKFSLRIVASVDPNQPFVRNEELIIIIFEKGYPANILQTSTYGTTARDYRIDDLNELYITNFKTLKTPTTYIVEIYRKEMLIGTFEFSTVM